MNNLRSWHLGRIPLKVEEIMSERAPRGSQGGCFSLVKRLSLDRSIFIIVALVFFLCNFSSAQSVGTVTLALGPMSTNFDICAFYNIGTCNQTYNNYGSVSVTVNGFTKSASYTAASTPQSVATALASALSVSGSPVTATASNGVISMTAVNPDPNISYSVSSSATYDTEMCGNSPCFYGPGIYPSAITLAPTVTTVSPSNGPAPGGTSVTITGTNFVSGATVKFGTASATGVTFVSSTSLTATTPVGSGTVNVVVTNPDTQTGTKTSGYTYNPAPTVISISPNNGLASGGTSVTITGTNFISGATVKFGTTTATGVTFVSSTTLTATTPAGSGTVNVVVTNPDTQTGTKTNGYTYNPAPTVTSVSPSSGPASGGTSVTITGTNFISGATVKFGTTTATGVTFVSSTSLTATTPAGSGTVNVVVTNPDTQIGTKTTGYTYNPAPTVTTVSPSSGPASGGTSVTITGTNFVSGATVKFGTTSATGVTFVSSTSLTATTPAGSGTVNVVVTNPDTQTGTKTNGYSYNPAPTVTTVSPSSGAAAGGTSVTITGTNFVSGATVKFGTTSATGVTFVSSTTLTATTPAGSGAVNVVVTNPDTQTGTETNGYTYNAAPTVTTISPGSGPLSGGTSVTITGTNFVSGATVKFGTASATGVTFVSSTSLTATTPAGSGTVNVVVTNPDTQTGTKTNGYSYNPAPTVTTVSPSSGAAAGGTSVTITGTNFVSGATVKFGTASATGMTFVSSTTLTATTPAGSGTVNVIVTNPDTQTGTKTSGYTYNAAPPNWIHVQTNARNSSAGTNALAFASANQAGNLIIAEVDFPSTSTFTSISDSKGNTYVQIGAEQTTGFSIKSRLYYAKNIASGTNTVTTVVSGSPAYHELYIHEYSGLDTTSPLDGFSVNAASSTSFTSGNVTTNFANDLLYGAEIDSGGASAGTGWTTRSTLDGNVVADKNGAAAGNYAYAGTSSGQYVAWIAAFKPSGTPSITSLSPTTGVVGTSVTITGTNFGSTQGTSTVKFNGTTATPTSWSATSIVVPVPSGATSGNVSVTVGGSTPPGVAVVQSSVGTAAAGTSVSASISPSVAGNLLIAMQMMPSGSSVSSVTDNKGSSWLHATGALSSSTGDNSVIDIWYCPNCSSGVTTITAHYAATVNFSGMIAYEMSGVATSSPFETGGNLSQGTVSGGNCAGPSLATTFTDLLIGVGDANNGFTGVSAPWVYGANQESYILNAVPGTYQLIYQVGAGSTACLASVAAFKTATGFTVGSGGNPAPTVTNVTPGSGPASGGTSVTITGTNFVSGATVKFGTASATGVTFVSSTSLTATTPAGSGAVNVVVTNPDTQTGTKTSGYTYNPAPTVTSVSPNNGTAAGGTSVTITGTNFVSGATVKFGTASATGVTFVSSTSLTATTPAGSGTVNVVVTNPDAQTGTKTNSFAYNPAPTVTSVSPTSGSGSGGTSVTITGTNFVSGATVKFGTTSATGVTFVSSTSLTATTPAGSGTVNVTVTNPDTQSYTKTNVFTYNLVPTFTSMSPQQGGVGLQVTITGTNFGSGCSVSVNGVSASVWSCTPTQIIFPVPPNASTGTVLFTTNGTQLNAGSFTVTSTVRATAVEYSYDAMGRVNQTLTCLPINCGTGPGGGFAMYYGYDLAGNMTSVSSYGGVVVNYGIDGANRVSGVTSSWSDAQHPATLFTVDPSIGYFPAGELRKGIYGNGLVQTNVYNNRLQPCLLDVVNSNTVTLQTCSDGTPSGNVLDLWMGYGTTNNNGNVLNWNATGAQSFTRTYAYDSLNRLQSMSAPGSVCSGLSWNVDAWGNRTAQNNTGGSCFAPVTPADTNNRLIGYQYDAAGNLTNDGNHTYTYDAENRVIQVDGGATATYVYDAMGNRVEKIAGGSDSEYLLDANAGGSINSVFTNGSWERMYVYFGGKALAQYYEGTTEFIHADHLGSTRLMTRLDQTTRECDDYYPYGELIPCGDTAGDRLKFTGKERDAETGLDNFGARYDSSSMGRFMTPDWIDIPDSVPFADFEYPQSLNLYSYVRNNPTLSSDPDGHDCVVQTRTSDKTEQVSSSSGNCDNVKVGDGESKTYVPGTVTSIQAGADGHSIDIGYTPDSGGSAGVMNANAAPAPDRPGLAWGYNQAGYRLLGTAGATMNDPRTFAGWYGASAMAGMAFIGSGAIGGTGFTTLAGDDGLGLVGKQAVNRMIGAAQRDLLRDFFRTGKLPEGLSQQTLRLYKTAAERAIAAGKDQLGVQAQRLEMISNALH
jgi:RHS repeat-associated protein